jgi:hypothetical protein
VGDRPVHAVERKSAEAIDLLLDLADSLEL